MSRKDLVPDPFDGHFKGAEETAGAGGAADKIALVAGARQKQEIAAKFPILASLDECNDGSGVVEPPCAECGAELGTTETCRACRKYLETIEAFRKPCLPEATYVHMTTREEKKT